MSSNLARRTTISVARKLHIDEEKIDKLGIAIRRSIHIDSAGHGNAKAEDDTGGSSDDEVEVEGIDSEGHHKELAAIQPFLNMAMAAYDDKSMADKFSFVKRSQLIKDLTSPTPLGKLNKHKIITTDTEVHVCLLEDGSLAFAFRGTETDLEDLRSLFGDLLTDLMKAQRPVEHYNASDKVAYRALPSIKAHQGFQLAFRDVTRTTRPNENIRLVAEGLGARTRDVRRVICIGHSLGGALATLCAHWCRYVAYPRAEVWCVTIGSPRVGNRAFAQDFNINVVTKSRSYRVVNKGDVIPNVPRFGHVVNVFASYKHVEGFVYLSEHPTRQNTITLKRGGRRPSLHARSFRDHKCDSYIDSVNRALIAFSHLHRNAFCLPPFT